MERTQWQYEAAACRFDDSAVRLRREQEAVARDPSLASAEPFVLGAQGCYYDPNDPSADWSGMVPKGLKGRKAVGPRGGVTTTVEQSLEGGIVAAEGYDQRPEYGRRKFDHDGRFQSNSTLTNRPPGSGSSYVTATMAAQTGAPTPQEALTNARRPGKKMVKPIYEDPEFYHREAARHPPAPQRHAAPRRDSSSGGSLAGYRAPQLNAGHSLLSASGISSVVGVPPQLPSQHQWDKELRTENYANPNTGIPGFAGNRRR